MKKEEEKGVVESAFEPETSVLRGTGFMGFGRDITS